MRLSNLSRSNPIFFLALTALTSIFVWVWSRCGGGEVKVPAYLNLSPLPPKSNNLCDFGNNQSYPCAPLFDPHFYCKAHTTMAGLNTQECAAHFLSVGVPQGARAHEGPRSLQIVLMTKNEWPLLKSWVLYHAELLGGHNLNIIDGSDLSEVRDFLNRVRDNLGVRVIFSKADLNGMTAEMNRVFTIVKPMSDFIIKLDTDEFLTLRDGAGFTTKGVMAYLDNLPVDGRKYKATFVMNSLPDASCVPGTSTPMHVTRFSAAAPWTSSWSPGMKTFFLAATFQGIDLGSHAGEVVAPYNSDLFFDTQLNILHFHYQCFEDVVANNLRALVSHGYVLESDGAAEQLEKCVKLLQQNPAMNSFHKVQNHIDFITKGFEVSKAAYYTQFQNVDQNIELHEMRSQLLELTERWLNM